MERTAGMEIFTCFFECNPRIDNINDIDAREQLVYELCGDLASHKRYYG
jgi:hypothetical protein